MVTFRTIFDLTTWMIGLDFYTGGIAIHFFPVILEISWEK